MPVTSPPIVLVAPEEAIETARLTLEPLRPDHAPALFPGLRDAALYRFIPHDPPASVERVTEAYRRLATRRSPDGREVWLNWAMRLRDGTGYAGTLQATVPPTGTAFVAYTVFTPQQRRGYATEGLAALLRLLFNGYGVQTVAAEIDTRNGPSIALAERLGFARVATTVDADHFKGTPSDEFRYELGRARRPSTAPASPAESPVSVEKRHP